AAAAAAVAGVAVLAYLATRGGGDGDGGAPSADRGATSAAGASVVPGRVALQVVPDPAAEEIPGVHCWDGLLDVDQSGSISELRGVLARALGSGDELLAAYVGDRLVELVGGDVAKAGALLDWADETSGPEAEIVLGALARTAAVHD